MARLASGTKQGRFIHLFWVPKAGLRSQHGRAEQVVDLGAGDVYIDELANGSRCGKEDASVDVWGIGVAACHEWLIHQRADSAADLCGGDFSGDFLLKFHGLAVAGGLGFVGDLVLHFGGARTFFLRIGEDAEAFEPGAFDEVEEVFEFLFGFAREPDNEGGTDMDAGDACPDPGDEIFDVFGGSLAAHEFEHAGVDMLEGHIDVAGDFFALGDAFDEFVAPVGGMGVQESDPEIAIDLVEFPEELGEGLAFGRIHSGFGSGFFLPQIHAEIGGVLADEVDFADPF